MSDFGWDDMGTYLTPQKEQKDAIQKRKPTQIPLREQAKDSEGVRKQDTEGEEPPEEDTST